VSPSGATGREIGMAGNWDWTDILDVWGGGQLMAFSALDGDLVRRLGVGGEAERMNHGAYVS